MTLFDLRHWYQAGCRVMAMVLAAGFFHGGWAQTSTALPEALRDIRQADGVCKNESPNAATSARRASATADTVCTLPVAGWEGFLQKPGAVIVDTRSEAQFGQFHVLNSMRMDLPAIQHKAYLRDKPLVLLGSGKSDRELYAACNQLRSQGFKTVQVALGGIAAYVASGKAIMGRAPSAFDLARLDAAELAEEAQFPDNLVVMVGNIRVSDALPYAMALPDGNAQALAALVEKRRKDGKLLAAVVLVSPGPLSTAAFQQYLQAVKPFPLLLYSDGAEALARFATSQKAVWAAHARGPKQPRCG